RLQRKLTREGYRAHVASPDELPEALRTLEELHRLQFGKQSSFLPFFDRFSRAAVAGARSNQVFFHTLYDAENTPVAIDVWIRAGNRLLNYIGGRHPDGPSGAGTVLIAAAIEDAYSRGIQEISLGSGFGGWKERWAPHRNDQLHLTGAVGLRARSLVWARDTARTAARLVRKDRNRDE
ncbi:MAG TPA: GNAT family N-acetyltransferase, partial [Acidimicrobiia bacterium]|nr:GNAT family N-acetyltransferase [Acidimicrobiia bacterium]